MSLAFDRLDPGWADALEPVRGAIARLDELLEAETAADRPWLPAPEKVLRAFEAPLADVRVLIVGQDPYPTPGHPIGLSFAVERAVRPLPRSLANIRRELVDDLGSAAGELPEHGDLSAWSAQGVLLLNRVLTVRAGAAGSHRRLGWEAVTAHAIRVLGGRHAAGAPLVALLWGRDAAALQPLLPDVPAVVSAHPSPLSARNGFFGSKPFSRVNALLTAQGAPTIDWRLG